MTTKIKVLLTAAMLVLIFAMVMVSRNEKAYQQLQAQKKEINQQLDKSMAESARLLAENKQLQAQLMALAKQSHTASPAEAPLIHAQVAQLQQQAQNNSQQITASNLQASELMRQKKQADDQYFHWSTFIVLGVLMLVIITLAVKSTRWPAAPVKAEQ